MLQYTSLLSLLLLSSTDLPLPLRNVVLYKNGLAYFEHAGTARGGKSIRIELPTSQLDDVLKSLTVIVSSDQIRIWVQEKNVDSEIETALSPIFATKDALRTLLSAIAGLDQEWSRIFEDQKRLRENLAGLGRGETEGALRSRYVRQLGAQEDRLAALRAERQRLEDRRSATQRELDKLLQGLAVQRDIS